MQGSAIGPRGALLIGYYGATLMCYTTMLQWGRLVCMLWEEVYLMTMQGGMWAQGWPAHRILHGYSMLLHDYAMMQGAELYVGRTLLAFKAACRARRSGYS